MLALSLLYFNASWTLGFKHEGNHKGKPLSDLCWPFQHWTQSSTAEITHSQSRVWSLTFHIFKYTHSVYLTSSVVVCTYFDVESSSHLLTGFPLCCLLSLSSCSAVVFCGMNSRWNNTMPDWTRWSHRVLNSNPLCYVSSSTAFLSELKWVKKQTIISYSFCFSFCLFLM